jgi:hypothetical protein
MASATRRRRRRTDMRKVFVEVETVGEAAEECPWAAEIVEAEGGFWCFESVEDAEIWKEEQE